MIELVRTMRFPHASDGYQEEAVDAFLDDIGAVLESMAREAPAAPARQSPEDAGKIAERTNSILAEAERAAAGMRDDAEREARDFLRRVKAKAEKAQRDADQYASTVRGSADGDIRRMMSDAKRTADETVAQAQAEAKRIVDDAEHRQEQVQASIRRLLEQEASILDEAASLRDQLGRIVSDHARATRAGVPPPVEEPSGPKDVIGILRTPGRSRGGRRSRRSW
jgi:DivIVA domain-containing protein